MVINVSNNTDNFVNIKKINKIVKQIIKEEYQDGNFELNIFLTDNKTIEEYNSKFRGKSIPTDVLSFEYGLKEEIIGDIVISIEMIKEQAKNFNNTFEEEFFYILIHGVLHILGYDHTNTDDQEEEMFKIQNKYFKKYYEEG
ncbi:rRNA maturation RNase YbeY [Geotoga petraea]|jgi:probable rRNA maturation factor|uniref:Endoribonuclease YbeY n=1 Tax=Geotoga petraea TaxID=28234 RepID=A0A1G6IFZ0_9BACT|nr:rRNA maturation RNase YbeY [Geotoga petraea]MDK2946166.1 putative rRNA maturation factor [Geotoga sp.]TGG89198.1 rRNA maturation RNase YbeY [Geotoga petraea]SDC05477.1 probable rRNA maturation factor [Geotoga petraea]